ncbi:hypothetical protein CDD83_11073 [Cordyceps sp. RAO-2017]|nr:hypothetical protein CDD83_11073 [Cordyceps sp. RAO-2017]
MQTRLSQPGRPRLFPPSLPLTASAQGKDGRGRGMALLSAEFRIRLARPRQITSLRPQRATPLPEARQGLQTCARYDDFFLSFGHDGASYMYIQAHLDVAKYFAVPLPAPPSPGAPAVHEIRVGPSRPASPLARPTAQPLASLLESWSYFFHQTSPTAAPTLRWKPSLTRHRPPSLPGRIPLDLPACAYMSSKVVKTPSPTPQQLPLGQAAW